MNMNMNDMNMDMNMHISIKAEVNRKHYQEQMEHVRRPLIILFFSTLECFKLCVPYVGKPCA